MDTQITLRAFCAFFLVVFVISSDLNDNEIKKHPRGGDQRFVPMLWVLVIGCFFFGMGDLLTMLLLHQIFTLDFALPHLNPLGSMLMVTSVITGIIALSSDASWKEKLCAKMRFYCISTGITAIIIGVFNFLSNF